MHHKRAPARISRVDIKKKMMSGKAAFCTPSSAAHITRHGLTRPQHAVTPRRKPCMQGNNRQSNDDNNDNDDDNLEVSRRVYLAGTAASTLITAVVSYRFFVGEDTESRLRTRLQARFPRLFAAPRTTLVRRPVDATFAAAYFDALEAVALKQRLAASSSELHTRERGVRQLASTLFFYDGAQAPSSLQVDLSNADNLNFALYARLHCLAQGTSPAQRVAFQQALAKRTLPLVRAGDRAGNEKGKGQAEQKQDATAGGQLYWVGGMEDILEALVRRGWIAAYDVGAVDAQMWAEDGRATVTVYAKGALTMQAAQLLGEEAFDQLGPRVSPWLVTYLRDCGLAASCEDYYLDDVYHADPALFRPTQFASQLDVWAPDPK